MVSILSVTEMPYVMRSNIVQGVKPDAQLIMFAGLERTENTPSEEALSNAGLEQRASESSLKRIN
jgi:hypothetical protein